MTTPEERLEGWMKAEIIARQMAKDLKIRFIGMNDRDDPDFISPTIGQVYIVANPFGDEPGVAILGQTRFKFAIGERFSLKGGYGHLMAKAKKRVHVIAEKAAHWDKETVSGLP